MKPLTIPSRSEWLLPLLSVLVLATAALTYNFDRRLPPVVWEGQDLVPGIVPEKLTKVTIKGRSSAFSLVKQDDFFTLDTLDHAPASPEKVNELLLRLGGAQIAQVLGGKEQWSIYEVDEKKAHLSIELRSGENSSTRLFIGKHLSGKPGRAVRLEGKDEVFATSESLYLLSEVKDYLQEEALKLEAGQFREVALSHREASVSSEKFSREELLASLSPLRVTQYHRTGATKLTNLNWEWKALLQKDDGTVINVSWAKKDDKWYARAHAELLQSLSENGPIIDLKQLTAKAQVDRFNQQRMPWIWELSEESIEKLKRGLMYGKEEQSKISQK